MAETAQVNRNIKRLEDLAEQLLKTKKDSLPRRPIVIEFCGCPKSGKTAAITALNIFLKRNGFKTKLLTERASVCPVENKFDPNFNIWTACSAIAELVASIANQSKQLDVIILDRGIFDAICWFYWLNCQDYLDDAEYDAVIGLLTMKKWQGIIDLIYVFEATPKTSLAREYAHLLTRKGGSIMNSSVLETYRASIKSCSKKYANSFRQIEVIDTTDKDLNTVNFEVTSKILSILKDLVQESIAFVSRQQIVQHGRQGIIPCSEIGEFAYDFKIRSLVESDKSVVQPIPIVVVTNRERNRVLCLRKKKLSTSFKSAEGGKLLLYAGGHIRREDQISEGDSLIDIAINALEREIREELNFNMTIRRAELNFFMWFPDNERSEKHFAICFVKEVDFTHFKVRLDPYEFQIADDIGSSGDILLVTSVIEDYQKKREEMESWTSAILENIFNERVRLL